MTIKQKQWQLYLLGYYPDVPNGINGPKTVKATKEFQKDFKLEVDGSFGAATTAKSIEVISSVQRCVKEFAVNTLLVDGYAGPKTQAAVVRWQLEQTHSDGILNMTQLKAMGALDEKPFFTRDNCRCKCGKYCNGFPVEPDQRVIDFANAIHDKFPGITISSVIRCERHNQNVGGSSRSKHKLGLAIDVHNNRHDLREVYRFADEYLNHSHGLGIYSWGIHVDFRDGKSRFDMR